MKKSGKGIALSLLVTALLGSGSTALGEAQGQSEVCRVATLYGGMQSEGPLKGCNVGDVVHFQLDTKNYAYASVVARYCNLESSVVVEQGPSSVAHVVCRYQWKWAKTVEQTPHPDAVR